jgi:serine/threonine protein kinase
MSMHLLVIAGPDKGRSFPLTPGEAILIGRSQATQTRLADPRVSKVHCEVEVGDHGATLSDSNSTGGTFINGKRISQCELKSGDVIQVGETQVKFMSGAGASKASTVAPGDLPSPRPAAALETQPLTSLSGQTLGHYEIGPVIAKGHSGVVFKAKDTDDGQVVAFKVLSAEVSQDEDDKQRFVRAMKTMMPLRHPNLVSVLGAGKTGNYCWIAMEYVDGESMTQVISRIGVAGMLDWRYTLRVGTHIARALEYAHGQQIIHRNIAPPNILVHSSDKTAKLGDLMLAKALEGTLAQQITTPGELLGDVNYISPERTHGSRDIDGRSDIYSLGASLYALLTGRPPFADVSLIETITKIRKAEPEKPKKFQMAIPDLFEGAVLKMISKRPDQRYQTAGELVKDLERVAKFQGVAV